jgi:hypothetical protein
MGLPPTTSKDSTDTSNVVTFNYQFPNFTGTHTATTFALGVNSVAGGGTGDSTLTANNLLIGAGTSPVTFLAPGPAGNVVASNGTAFISTSSSGFTPLNYVQAYFSGSSSWSTTSGTYTDPTNSGGNTLSIRQFQGITLTAGTSPTGVCGVTFTPSSASAVYLVLARVNATWTSSDGINLQLTDGTTVIDNTGFGVAFSGAVSIGAMHSMGGIYVPGTTSPVTVKVQVAAFFGGTANISSDTSLSNPVEWTIIQLNTVGGSGSSISLGAFGSSPNADGLSLSGSTLNMQPASASFPGGVSTTTQTFAGAKAISTGGSTTAFTVDSPNFVFDTTNDAFGIGLQPATTVAIDIINSSGSSKAVQGTNYGVGSSIPFRGRFARGTSGSPAAAQNGDSLVAFSGRGYGTSQFPSTSTGSLNFVAGETFTNTSNATYLQFQVTPTGSVTLTEAMRINSTGNLLIGTTTDSGTQKLQVNGNSNVGTVTAGVWNGTVTAGQSVLTTGTTYTTPAGITTATRFKFMLIGGGAGGSSANAAADHSSTGGAGGGLILYTTGLSPSTGYTITIGSGGGGGASGAVGSAGGSTTLVIGLTTYTAAGGSAAAAVTGNGGAGGTATNGTINITGGTGGPSMGVATSGGLSGGSSPFGMGLGGAGNGPSVAANGQNATGFGGGGGGASSNGSPTGGAGTGGIIVVEWNN